MRTKFGLLTSKNLENALNVVLFRSVNDSSIEVLNMSGVLHETKRDTASQASELPELPLNKNKSFASGKP